jgi:hypothetical protein
LGDASQTHEEADEDSWEGEQFPPWLAAPLHMHGLYRAINHAPSIPMSRQPGTNQKFLRYLPPSRPPWDPRTTAGRLPLPQLHQPPPPAPASRPAAAAASASLPAAAGRPAAAASCPLAVGTCWSFSGCRRQCAPRTLKLCWSACAAATPCSPPSSRRQHTLTAALHPLHAATDSKHRDVVDACKALGCAAAAAAIRLCNFLSFFPSSGCLPACVDLQYNPSSTLPPKSKLLPVCRWVDDCHAVVICSDPKAARQLLEAATSPSAAPTDFQLRGYADAGSGTRKLPPSGAPAHPVAGVLPRRPCASVADTCCCAWRSCAHAGMQGGCGV